MSDNPFPGLRPFKQGESSLFFGRDGQSDQLLKRLQDSRFLALVGVSGSGKSSLIRAGLLPKLDGALMSAAQSHWRVAVFRPGDNPISNMARALVADAKLGGDSGYEDIEAAIAETTLRRGNLGLLELIKEAKSKVRENGEPFLGPKENILIVVDQFEEIFRIIEQHEDLIRVKQLSGESSTDDKTAVTDDLKGHPREEASAFVKLLLESTTKNEHKKYDENVYIIVTMRSDYLGDTAQFLGMPEKINEGQYLIPRMDRKERRKAIEGPIAVRGGSITEPLVNQLLNDAGEDPGKLPILQHALMRMWDLAEQAPQNGGLNLDHYKQIETLDGALSQHANEAFRELSKEHQELASKIFKCLTEKGLANRETRRPMKIADICEVVGAKETDVRTVVDCFRKNGRWFLMPSVDEKKKLTPDTLIDISHESLISGWDKLRDWVNEEAESARVYKRLADTAILKEVGREEFYRGAALEVALEWRDDHAPNPAWARRYHPEFNKAIAFLDDSLADTLRRRRNRNILISIVCLVTFGSLIFGIVSQQRTLNTQARALAREKVQVQLETDLKDEAISEKSKALAATALAEEERRKADLAKQDAVDAAEKLEESLKNEKAALKIATDAKAVAILERDNAVRLQRENEEQTRIYTFFKTAFDHVASREYDKAIEVLGTALFEFQQKEQSALKQQLEEPSALNQVEIEKARTNQIAALINIADIHRIDNDPNTDGSAFQEYGQALKLIGDDNDKLRAPTLMKAASVWKDSKVVQEARNAADMYEEAASVYRNLRSNIDASRAWIEAGKIRLRFVDEAGLDKASKNFDNAVSVLDGSQLSLRNAEIGEYYLSLVVEAEESTEEEELLQAGTNTAGTDDGLQERLRRDGAKFFGNAAAAFEGSLDFTRAAAMEVKRGEILKASKSPELLQTAANAFRSASTFYAKAGNPAESASVLVDAGRDFLKNGAAKQHAVKLLEEAADIDQKNPAQQTATLSRIGAIYAALESPDQKHAFDYYQRAIDFAHKQKDKAAQVTAILAKVRGVERLKGVEGQSEVEELYKKAVSVYEDDPARKVETMVKVGKTILDASREEARIPKAEQFFQAALVVALAQPDKKIAASAHLEIGQAYRLNRAKAAENFKSALTMYEIEGDLYGQAMALYRLSVLGVTGAREFTDRSLALFEKVMPTLEASGTSVELAEAFFALGSLHRRKQNYEASLSSYNRALGIFQQLPALPDQESRLTNVRNLIRSVEKQMEP